ncbi:MAG: TonB-dependent siderophore receptor [Pseudomonadota bacterium]
MKVSTLCQAIRRSLRTGSHAAGAALLAVGSSAIAQDEDELIEEVVVVAERAEFFRPRNAMSSTKLNLPIVETPQAITVLTDDILELTGSLDLEDTVGLVPGYVNKGSYGGFDNRFNARGFDLSVAEGVLLNGLPIASNVDRDLLGVSSIEYLRGPTSIVLGTLNYGGAVNIITRRPSAEREIDISYRGGSFSAHRLELEYSGPLNESGTVRGYGGLGYETRNGFRDGEGLEKTPIKLALDVDFGENTQLQIDASIESGEADPVSLFSQDYRDGSVPDFIPSDWNGCSFVEGCFNDYDNRDITGRVLHRFNDSLSGRITSGYAETERRHRFVSFLGLGGPEAFGFGVPGPFAFWYTYDDEDTFETYFTELALTGKFDAFGRENDFILLAEYRDREITENYQLQDPSTFFAQFANILAPTTSFGVGDIPISVQPVFPWDQSMRNEENLAFTAQVVLRPTDRLQLLLGARYESEDFDQTGINNGGSGGPFGSSRDVNVSGDVSDTIFRAGLVYEVTDGVFGYASYSEGFLPTNVNDDAGQPIPAETGTQLEVGLKGEFFDGALGAGITAFSIERDDVASVVGDGVLASPSTRSQDHEGVELEVIGAVTERLDLIATFSYLDTEVTKELTDDSLVGNEIPNAPNNLASIFVQYQLPPLGGLDGFSVGGGARYVGTQWVNDDNSLQIDSYTLVEANLTYQPKDQVRAQIGVRNLTDEEYFVQFLGTGFAGWGYGETRALYGTVSYRF